MVQRIFCCFGCTEKAKKNIANAKTYSQLCTTATRNRLQAKICVTMSKSKWISSSENTWVRGERVKRIPGNERWKRVNSFSSLFLANSFHWFSICFSALCSLFGVGFSFGEKIRNSNFLFRKILLFCFFYLVQWAFELNSVHTYTFHKIRMDEFHCKKKQKKKST